MNIIMLGAQGSGKGTVGTELAENLNLVHISTGDIFRENIKNNTPLGIEANGYISKGQLVPDELTNRIVEDRLSNSDTENGVVLDGYPRTIAQCEELDKMLSKLNRKLDVVINLEVPHDELIDRIAARRVCSKCKKDYNVNFNPSEVEGICDLCGGEVIQRADDVPETVEKRLQIYYANAQGLIDYYTKKGILRVERASDKENITSRDIANKLVQEYK